MAGEWKVIGLGLAGAALGGGVGAYAGNALIKQSKTFGNMTFSPATLGAGILGVAGFVGYFALRNSTHQDAARVLLYTGIGGAGALAASLANALYLSQSTSTSQSGFGKAAASYTTVSGSNPAGTYQVQIL